MKSPKKVFPNRTIILASKAHQVGLIYYTSKFVNTHYYKTAHFYKEVKDWMEENDVEYGIMFGYPHRRQYCVFGTIEGRMLFKLKYGI